MLTALAIRDVVLVEALDLEFERGLTVLTGETGAGKSIILDSLGLATGARADSGLVRHGAKGLSVTASFELVTDHGAFSLLEARGLEVDPAEPLVLRRQVTAEGRSKAYVNDQAVSVGVLKDLGDLVLEVHGQHETTGLLDTRTHRGLLDAFGDLSIQVKTVRDAHKNWRTRLGQVETLMAEQAQATARLEEISQGLADLDRLDPRPGEEADLAEQRAILGASEKALSDIAQAREQMGGDQLSQRLAGAYRALERARERALKAGATPEHPILQRLDAASGAVDRALMEAQEALAAIDLVAESFDFDQARLDRVEERLFELRAAARKFNMAVDLLPQERERLARALRLAEDGTLVLTKAKAEAEQAKTSYLAAASQLSAARRTAAEALSAQVMTELAPLKLDKARFRVGFEALDPERGGAEGLEKISFEVQTNPGAAFGDMAAIASGGELARFALALKAALATRAAEQGNQPVMIFDEVDQGVGGAVADAVGLRLKALSQTGQVLVVTHSPQVAARGHAHFKVQKAVLDTGEVRTALEVLAPARRAEELARMLSGAEVTEAARAAAKALLEA